MNNNVNNNVNPSTNGVSTSGVSPSTSVPPSASVNPSTNVNNVTATNNANVVPPVVNAVNNSTVIPPVVNTVANNVPASNNVVNNQNNINNQDGIASNTYVIVGSIVGVVLLASVVLLVLLVTGVIGNRNRMTCTKTTNEAGYVYTEKRAYKFDKGYYTRVDRTFTYNYTNLTDDIYIQEFGELINSNSGVSSYGFGTTITREGNIVTITAYEPRYFDQTFDDIETMNNKEGFTCK